MSKEGLTAKVGWGKTGACLFPCWGGGDNNYAVNCVGRKNRYMWVDLHSIGASSSSAPGLRSKVGGGSSTKECGHVLLCQPRSIQGRMQRKHLCSSSLMDA